ncbi:hypothetical protein [Elioraea sp.]|uniref:hypothetical protein n=1 Tax=Elioraea sp. TaxID=2185103 RepID=UPI0025C5AB1F|nr:hypothetical protein [Elioraea sp.]
MEGIGVINDVLASLGKFAADQRVIAAVALTALTALCFSLVLTPNPLLVSPMRLLILALFWLALVWLVQAAYLRLRRHG